MPNRPNPVQRPQRWDEPFSSAMSAAAVARVLTHPPFCSLDQSGFTRGLSLPLLLRNDARIVRYAPGDIVVRQGDYGNSAFFILTGTARVSVSTGSLGIPEALLGRGSHRRRGWIGALAQIARGLRRESRIPELRELGREGTDAVVAARRSEDDQVRVFIQDLPTVLARYETERLDAGEAFGEIAALSRTPRTATVFAETQIEAVEIRWQGLRDIRSRCPEVKEQLDRKYRERSLRAHLRETPVFAHLDEAQILRIAAETEFETFGTFNWHAGYKTIAGQSAAQRLGHEPVIVEEGDYANGLLLVRSGFARVSERYGHGHRTVRYLGRGEMFGLEELYHNWKHHAQVPLARTLRAIGYTDLLIVPTSIVEAHVFPNLSPDLVPPPVSANEEHEVPGSRRAGRSPAPDPVTDERLERLVEDRYINGTATMVIDLDRCTRCDDCVRACADAHDGNPRFIRHGREVGRYMVANACMHCTDPVCMIGCPTGAIHREPGGGQVVINDEQCIGCATCANSCPYENIRMVEVRDRSGAFVVDELTGRVIRKATKCDLCVDQLVVPACERACPHGALKRVDMGDLEGVRGWLGR